MRKFIYTFDYRCPFARNMTELIYYANKFDDKFKVDPIPLCLDQFHVEPDEMNIWDLEDRDKYLVALLSFNVVKEYFPDEMWKFHMEMFLSRHDLGINLRSEEQVLKVLKKVGFNDTDALFVIEEAKSDKVVKSYAESHIELVEKYEVFGVPTIVLADSAVFVRLMERTIKPSQKAVEKLEYIIGMVEGHPDINEIKHTIVPK